MATVREKINAARAAGVPAADIRRRMRDLGLRKADVDLDYEVAKQRGAARMFTGPLPPGAQVSTEPVSGPATVAPKETPLPEEQTPEMDTAGLEPVGLPGAAMPTQLEEPSAADLKRYERVGGLFMDPIASAEFLYGVGKGVATQTGEALSRLGEEPPEEQLKIMSAAGAEARKTRERRKEQGFLSGLGEDVLTTVGGLANMVGTAAIGTVVEKEGEADIDAVALGEKMGQATVPAMAGVVVETVTNPLETARTSPFTTALTVVPLAMAAAKLARGTKATAAAEKILDQAQQSKAVQQIISRLDEIEDGEAVGKLYRDAIDAMQGDSPQATVLLDELVQKTKELDSNFGYAAKEIIEPTAEKQVAPGMQGFGPPSKMPAAPQLIDPDMPPVPMAATSRLGKRAPATGKAEPSVAPLIDADAAASALAELPETIKGRNTTELLDEIGKVALSEFKALRDSGKLRGSGMEQLTNEQMMELVKNTVAKNIIDARATDIDMPDFFNRRGTIKQPQQVAIETITQIRDNLKAANIGRTLEQEHTRVFSRVHNKNPEQIEMGISTNGISPEEAISTMLVAARTDKPLPNYIRIPSLQRFSKQTILDEIERRTAQLTDRIRAKARKIQRDNPNISQKEIIDLAVKDNDKRLAALIKVQRHIDGLEEVADYGATGVVGLVDPAIAGFLTHEKSKAIGGVIHSALSQLPKTVALPGNPRAIINNIVGNEVLTSLLYGRIPGQNLIKGLVSKVKPGAQNLSPAESQFLDAARRTGIFDANVIRADIQNQKLVSPGSVSKLAEKIGKPGGWAMSKGDEIYRVPMAYREWEKAKFTLNALDPSEFMEIPVSPNVIVRLVKKPDGNVDILYLAKTKNPFKKPQKTAKRIRNASETQINDVFARYGKNQSDNYYFDYDRIPNFLKAIRRAPVIGAGSPFFTWSWKALDLPGVKKGLLSPLLRGPTDIVTNSLAANVRLAADDVAVALKRVGLAAAVQQDASTDPEMARMLSWNPKEPSTIISKPLSNPAIVAAARYSSANFLEPTLAVMDLASQSIDWILEKYRNEPDLLQSLSQEDIGSVKFMKLAQRLRQAATTKRDPIPTALKLVGLGGGLMLDVYNKALDAEDQGKKFDVTDFAKSYVPGPLRTYIFKEGSDERFRYAEPGLDAVEDALDFHVRNLIGLGYQTINTKDAYQRYRRGVKQEMEAMLDKWRTRRAINLAQKMIAPEAEARATRDAERVAAAVEIAIADMDRYWGVEKNIDTTPRGREE